MGLKFGQEEDAQMGKRQSAGHAATKPNSSVVVMVALANVWLT